MNGSVALGNVPTTRGTNSAIAWATKDGLYVEIPCKDGPPYVCRYRLTTEGLAAALNILIEHEAATTTQITDHPKITRPLAKFTDANRQAALDVLRRLKII